jgi:hypothetical protein
MSYRILSVHESSTLWHATVLPPVLSTWTEIEPKYSVLSYLERLRIQPTMAKSQ